MLIITVASTFYLTNMRSETTISKFRKDYIALQSSTKAVLDSNKVLSDSTVKLLKSVSNRDSTITQLQNKISFTTSFANKLRKEADSLRKELAISLPDTCGPALELADKYKEEADSLRVVVVDLEKIVDSLQQNSIELKSAIALSDARAERAELSLKKYIELNPPRDTDKLFGIKLPSRITTAIIMFGAGYITSEIVNR